MTRLIDADALLEVLSKVSDQGYKHHLNRQYVVDLITNAPTIQRDHIDVNKMVNSFLGWKLPHNFFPDAGISFNPKYPHDSHCWPIGTNLFTATQAKAMIEYMLAAPTETE